MYTKKIINAGLWNFYGGFILLLKSDSKLKPIVMKSKLKFFVSLFVAAAIAIGISAFKLSSETCSVTGKIKDKSTKAVIAFVNVELFDLSGKKVSSAITDFEGTYTLTSSAGTFNIRASFNGYKSSVRNGITL